MANDYDPIEDQPLTTPIGEEPKGVLHPQNRSFRALLLFGACILTFGSYFSMDVPGAIGSDQMAEFYNVSTFGYSLLYSVYAIPNIILPLFGGMIVDRYLGPKFGGILFALIVLIGQTIFSIGSIFPQSGGYYVSLFGRFVFGLGGENLSVTQSTYCAKWFGGKELAFAFSMTLSFARFGSAINFIAIPTVVEFTGISIGMWIATLMCGISLAAALYLAFLDYVGEKQLPVSNDDTEDEVIRLRDVPHFGIMYWYLTGICTLFYISVFVFVQYSSGFFTYTYDVSSSRAGLLNSVIYLTSAICSPFIGIMMDKVGYPLYFLAGACFLYSAMMVSLLTITFIPPIIPMILCGVAYTLVASSLWPTIPLVVKPHQVGTGYGVAFSVQNFGQFVAPMFISAFIDVDHPADYGYAVFTFAVTAFLAGSLALSMTAVDVSMGRRVNLSAPERKEQLKQLELEAAMTESTDYKAGRIASVNEDEEYIEKVDVIETRRKRNSKSVFM